MLNSFKIKDNNNFLDFSIPNLVDLSVSFSTFDEPNDNEERQFRKLVEKNPQIQWLLLRYTTTQLVKSVSEYLQNLKILILPIITAVDYKDEIHFKHVTNFRIEQVLGGCIENITFERLEELFCFSSQSNWPEFVEKNPKLKKIALDKFYSADDNHISLLPKIATNLVEASFNIGPDPENPNIVRVETIVKLLNECKYMERLYL